MIGIVIEWLAGRYHGTPWDKQVNEGVVEWPPSPWRILRSLVSAYYRLPDPPDRAEVCDLLTCLSDQLPQYLLPSYTAAHTRHYMPLRKEGKMTTALVLDTFHAISKEAPLIIGWPNVTLSDRAVVVLERLCAQVTYVGRAESWAELSVTTEVYQWNAQPCETGGLKVLVPLNGEQLAGFRQALAVVPQPKKGKGVWSAPEDILEALALDVGALHRQGWNGIPGSRWVMYGRSPDSKSMSQRSLGFKTVPNFARFALCSPVLPRVTQAVSVGERFRQALMARSQDRERAAVSSGEERRVARVFSGKETNDRTATDNSLKGQEHAYFLPEVNERGLIDHVVVFAAGGFVEAEALRALGRLSKVWGNEGFNLQTVLVSLGQVSDYRGVGGWSVLGESRRWRSLTPMVLPRFPKKKCVVPGADFLVDGVEHQALKLLCQLPHLGLKADGLAIAQAEAEDLNQGPWLMMQASSGKRVVKVRQCSQGVTRYRWVEFGRQRYHGGGKRALDQGFWLEVEFAEPVGGPIAIGYAAHFGLGVLVPRDH